MPTAISSNYAKPMPRHDEIRLLPFTPDQMFDLVSDVDSYPKFLPWCIGVRVRDRQKSVFLADLLIGFKMLREKYSSRVVLNRSDYTILVEYLDGPFRFLDNSWKFIAEKDGGTRVEFHINFEFKSRLLQSLIGRMFEDAVSVMVSAFEKRAHDLYGSK